MTEKRFYLNEGEVGILKILDLKEDNEAIYHTTSKSDMKMVVELLNRLSEEKEQLKHDATVLICSNQEYRKKNEQLKCGNKNLKNILNDFINICNRLQANPADKQTLNVARDMLQNMGVDLE